MRKRTKRGSRRGCRARKEKKNINDKGIFNLSHATFSDAEKLILDKGLKYVPPKKLNKFSTIIDVQKFIRKLNIQRHFIINPLRPATQESVGNTVHSGLSNPSRSIF